MHFKYIDKLILFKLVNTKYEQERDPYGFKIDRSY